MANKRFTAKKVGDQYVMVPQGTQHEMTRGLCAAGGILVGLFGFRRGGLLGMLVMLFGMGWAYKGFTGRSPIEKLLGQQRGGRRGEPSQSPSHQGDWKESAQLPADELDEAAMESFPASDPPAPAVRH